MEVCIQRERKSKGDRERGRKGKRERGSA